MKVVFFLLVSLTTFNAFAQSLKVATWNILWLSSHEYNVRSESDYPELAKYATQLDADIIALQEVENAAYAQKVLGDGYDYYFSTKDWVQRVGFAVRKSLPYSVDVKEYRDLSINNVRYGMDLKLTQGKKELRLLAVHLKSGCFTKPLDVKSLAAMPTTSRKEEKRKQACETLAQQRKPLEAWIDARQAEGVPFAVLGDFNRRLVQDVAQEFNPASGFWQDINNSGEKGLWSPTLNRNSDCWGGYYKDYIDHIIMNPQARQKYVAGSFDQLLYGKKYTRELSEVLSDHCPISVELVL